jgi:hypothetical protein
MRLHSVGALPVLLALLAVAGCENGGLESSPVRPATSGPVASAVAATPPVRSTAARESSEDGETSAAQPGKHAAFVPRKREPRELILVSMRVADAPTLDGRADEPFWKDAPAITTLDYSSQRPITLRSVHTAQEIFFLVTYPEETPSETHKTWTWDPKEEVYREGPDREDVFVFKWSMSGNNVDLKLRNPEPHRGDIWFWKARRTNPSGYADDKWQSVSATPSPTSRKIPSSSGAALYFRREGDTGKPAWDEKFYFEYQGPTLPKYAAIQPEGSRADVRAKGVWSNKQWTIELGRKLNTGHDDDVVFTPGAAHLFGVACYAMASDTPHESWSQPLYRTGDVFDRLLLSIPGNKVRK